MPEIILRTACGCSRIIVVPEEVAQRGHVDVLLHFLLDFRRTYEGEDTTYLQAKKRVFQYRGQQIQKELGTCIRIFEELGDK